MHELKVVSLRPKTPDYLHLYAPLLRLLEERGAAMETLQVYEVPLPSAGREEQDHLSEDPLVGQGRPTGTEDSGELGPGQTEAAGTGSAQTSPGTRRGYDLLCFGTLAGLSESGQRLGQ